MRALEEICKPHTPPPPATHIIVSDSTSAILAIVHFNGKALGKQLSRHSSLILERICMLWKSIQELGSRLLCLAVEAHAGYRPNIYADCIATDYCTENGPCAVGEDIGVDLPSSLSWFGYKLKGTDRDRLLYQPVSKFVKAQMQSVAISKHASDSECNHRCPTGCNRWIAKALVHPKHTSAMLGQFITMCRIDRINSKWQNVDMFVQTKHAHCVKKISIPCHTFSSIANTPLV